MRTVAVCVLLLTIACSSPTGTAGVWEELASMEVARSEHPGISLDGEVVVVGGLVGGGLGGIRVSATVEAYDPTQDRWRRLPDLPEPRHHAMAAVTDGRLFVIGGYDRSGFQPTDSVWELDGDGWVARASLPHPQGAGAAVVWNGSVVVIGGAPCGDCVLRYDPVGDTWEGMPSLRTPREHLAAVATEDAIWVLAGRWVSSMHRSVEVWSQGRWAEGPSLIHARSGFGAVAVEGGLMVGGGEVFGPTQVLDSVEILRDGRWVEVEPLPMGLHGMPLVAVGDRVYLPGGSVAAGGVDNPGSLFARSLR